MVEFEAQSWLSALALTTLMIYCLLIEDFESETLMLIGQASATWLDPVITPFLTSREAQEGRSTAVKV